MTDSDLCKLTEGSKVRHLGVSYTIVGIVRNNGRPIKLALVHPASFNTEPMYVSPQDVITF